MMTSWICILITSVLTVLVTGNRAVDEYIQDGLQMDNSGNGGREKRQTETPSLKITTYHIKSTVTTRFVTTSVSVTVINEASSTQNAQFQYQLRQEALVSGFAITIDGIPYGSQVYDRDGSRTGAYRGPRRRGPSVTRVINAVSHNSQFNVDVDLEAGEAAVFNLNFQEILRRDKGQYRQAIGVAPGQVVDGLLVEVDIIETQGLQWVSAIWTPSNPAVSPVVSFLAPSPQASISLSPSVEAQTGMSSARGMHGFLEVTYDVQHPLDGGDLQVLNGYFVHHISPEGLPIAPKRVIFLIDVSTSMRGKKLTQTKAAMTQILGQLRSVDYFNVMAYSYGVRPWKRYTVPVTPTNVAIAQHFVRNLRANGGTNVHNSLVTAAHQFDENDNAFPVIVFMTDGRPNVGLTRTNDILKAVKRATNGKVALYTIGFGEDVDDVLLERLASENQGRYRRVPADGDASLRMRGFFEEIATPLLYNIEVDYLNNSVDADTLTDNSFISYFDGDEMVVAGKLSDEFTGGRIDAVVSASDRDGPVELRVSKEIDEGAAPGMVQDYAQRVWAMTTIQDYMTMDRLTTSPAKKAVLQQKILDLSLKYSFVTPQTALRVVSPPTLPSTSAPTTPIPSTPAPATPIPSARTPATPLPITEPFTNPKPVTESSSVETQPNELLGDTAAQTGASTSRVGADPHFIIDIPDTNLTICFDLQAENGTIINLVNDSALGIYINAGIVSVGDDPLTSPGSGPARRASDKSMIGSLGFFLDHHRVLVTSKHVMIDFEIEMRWGMPKSFVIGEYNMTIHDEQNFTIVVRDVIVISVVLRNHWRNHVDHFDINIVNSNGFSKSVHGLIGQFQRKHIRLKNPSSGTSKNGHTRGVVDIEGRERFVYKMMETLIHDSYECWWSTPDTYIDGFAGQYFVAGFFSHLPNNNFPE